MTEQDCRKSASTATAMLYIYEIATGRCCAALHPAVGQTAELRLAYSGDRLAQAWAFASASGVVKVYRSDEMGNAHATVRAAPHQPSPAPPPEDAEGGGNNAESAAPPELVWCCDTLPILAVAASAGVVLLFLYEASNRALLLQARVPVAGASRPRALAWAPGLGALVAAFEHEFQFWLLSADRLASSREAALMVESRDARIPDATCA